jgi:nucleoside-diphosphate-sugar epimerase
VLIDDLVSKVEKIGGVKLKREYDLNAPRGVAGRNSDNTFIKSVLSWEPNTTLDVGLPHTYDWIKEQYYSRKLENHTARLEMVEHSASPLSRE